MTKSSSKVSSSHISYLICVLSPPVVEVHELPQFGVESSSITLVVWARLPLK